ncbi:hypothetical protein GCM10010399_55330 [Dactylosporangium fulvum]|uniref:Calcium-binding protein n=1 Tax=Dactylosporangium fulvum TaxID=53359 RepID=A0ABY5W0Z5_9ACTN|nr:calcium-binding protein [Dactylosporangium fulvum]UWP83100.1 calcium-binding protein [Dactylosporangium fulvum]
MSRYERGLRLPRCRSLEVLAACLDVPLQDLQQAAAERLMPAVRPGPPMRVCRWSGYSAAVGSLSRSQLDALVEEATVDCYNEDEQLTGLFTMIEDNLALPFTTEVLGVDGIVAICHRSRER